MFNTNEYFEGKVKSIAFNTGEMPATVGVMAPGEYIFNTADPETMTVVSGSMSVQLPGETQPASYQAGQSFDVPANSTFNVSVETDTAYLCLYG